MPFRSFRRKRASAQDDTPRRNVSVAAAPSASEDAPMKDGETDDRRAGLHIDTGARRRLGDGVGKLGFEIVDIAALLKLVDDQAVEVDKGLSDLRANASEIKRALDTATTTVAEVAEAADGSVTHARDSMDRVQAASGLSRQVAEWVGALGPRISGIEARLADVEQSTARIGDIAAEVGILAINARIVAARAGEHGKGFAVVAEAISDLARQTAEVTTGISGDVTAFSTSVGSIRAEIAEVLSLADQVLESGHSTDAALNAVSGHLETTQRGVARLGDDLATLTRANETFRPVLDQLVDGIENTGTKVHDGHARVEALIDLVETLVQANAAIGGATDDGKMIETVQSHANRIAEAFADALTVGTISEGDLFDTAYVPIAGSDPPQVMTRFVALTDRLLPPIQEPVLELDLRIVFCAAVDRNGYLPTHNRKFSHPQSRDPVWNAANCRNRRIFDDRVGLKAGRSTAPFLLQVYRRDMGGGASVLMKDLSAPITIAGRHWGGLRLAYRPR
jgi:methyl-accepting chemotaxis protein